MLTFQFSAFCSFHICIYVNTYGAKTIKPAHGILLSNMQTQKYLKLANCYLSNVGISKVNHFLAFNGQQHFSIIIKAQ